MLVDAGLLSPQNPFARRGPEVIDIETGHQRWVQVCQLVLLAVVHGRYDAAARGQGASCQLAVQRQVHNGLEYLRPGAVQLVQKQHHGLVVSGEPVGRHKDRLPGGFVLVGQANQISRVTHLSQEQRHYLLAFGREEVCDDLGLTNAVLPGQHNVMRGWRALQQVLKLFRVDIDCHIVGYLNGDTISIISS